MIFNLERFSNIKGLDGIEDTDFFENIDLDLEDKKTKSVNSLVEI